MTTHTSPSRSAASSGQVLGVLQKYWGYPQLRPLQAEAIECGLAGQDSLVVMPTGGGKSLCYQIPPMVAGRTDVVVSPLIALMKDQVDGLRANGYPAAAVHSGMTESERRVVEQGILQNEYRLLLVAPERLLNPSFMALMRRARVSSFAIDEAHCISHWGHDFRPEYRRLAELREAFPDAAMHAFTATATERVRQDIITQLGLRQPRVLVGRFDRPNLSYRVLLRGDLDRQLVEVLGRHKGEAAIVYCISRADTERTAAALQARGFKAAAYHAGMDATARARTQEAFTAERLDVVVATVAFGMGIDRSNVRCVVHAALPKSVEQYQQETGRAGRDGLEAECVLLYGPGDAARWEGLMTRSGAEAGQPRQVIQAQIELLRDMDRFANARQCRHAMLTRYFGQDYPDQPCGACDACLEPGDTLANGGALARQILACVAGLRSAFGVNHVVDVLTGARTARLQEFGHDRLKEYGALKDTGKDATRDLLFQLVDQGLLERTEGDRPVIKLRRPAADEVLSGRREVTLMTPKKAPTPLTREEAGWQDVDRDLFERLRGLRRSLADERAVPAYVILSDATLRDLARLRPTTLGAFGRVKGVGERKVADFGQAFIHAVDAYSREKGLQTDVSAAGLAGKTVKPNPGKEEAYRLFEQGRPLAEVAAKIGRAPSTASGYLEEWVAERMPHSLDAWVSPEVYARIEAAGQQVGAEYLKPVFEALNGEVSYDDIRIVLKHAGLR